MRSLLEFRRSEGLTQAELAVRLGVTQSQVSRLERGHSLPSPRLSRTIDEVATDPEARGWIGRVEHAARGSPEFKALVDAALQLMHRNA